MSHPTPTGPSGSAATGAADEQALNQLKYKRFLESIAGFAPGESDLPDDEILRRRALAGKAQGQGQNQARPQAQAAAGAAPGSRPHALAAGPGCPSRPSRPESWPPRA